MISLDANPMVSIHCLNVLHNFGDDFNVLVLFAIKWEDLLLIHQLKSFQKFLKLYERACSFLRHYINKSISQRGYP